MLEFLAWLLDQTLVMIMIALAIAWPTYRWRSLIIDFLNGAPPVVVFSFAASLLVAAAVLTISGAADALNKNSENLDPDQIKERFTEWMWVAAQIIIQILVIVVLTVALVGTLLILRHLLGLLLTRDQQPGKLIQWLRARWQRWTSRDGEAESKVPDNVTSLFSEPFQISNGQIVSALALVARFVVLTLVAHVLQRVVSQLADQPAGRLSYQGAINTATATGVSVTIAAIYFVS